MVLSVGGVCEKGGVRGQSASVESWYCAEMRCMVVTNGGVSSIVLRNGVE